MDVRDALLQRQSEIAKVGDKYERHVSVAGADYAILSLKQGDVLSITDPEGRQSAEVFAVTDTGRPLRFCDAPAGRNLADVIGGMEPKSAAVRHAISARNIDPSTLDSEWILSGENLAGASISVEIPDDAAESIVTVGDAVRFLDKATAAS